MKPITRWRSIIFSDRGTFFCWPVKEAYVGVEQVEAVQALASMHPTFDAAQGRSTLAHRQRECGGGRQSCSTGATSSTNSPIRTPGSICGGRISIWRGHPAQGTEWLNVRSISALYQRFWDFASSCCQDYEWQLTYNLRTLTHYKVQNITVFF